MIHIENLSKGFWVRDQYREVISNLSLTIPAGRAIGLLGRNGAGKSTLLKMISGRMQPSSGRIRVDGRLSWPVGGANSFHRDMTGLQNTRFLARVYGVDSDALEAFVQDFAELGRHYHMPLRSYSSGMKSRLAFGVAMGIPFDIYLIDEVTAVGDARFKRKSRAVFRARMAGAGAIMVSHSMAEMRTFCDSGMVLHEGRVEYYEDILVAIERHESLMAGSAPVF